MAPVGAGPAIKSRTAAQIRTAAHIRSSPPVLRRLGQSGWLIPGLKALKRGGRIGGCLALRRRKGQDPQSQRPCNQPALHRVTPFVFDSTGPESITSLAIMRLATGAGGHGKMPF